MLPWGDLSSSYTTTSKAPTSSWLSWPLSSFSSHLHIFCSFQLFTDTLDMYVYPQPGGLQSIKSSIFTPHNTRLAASMQFHPSPPLVSLLTPWTVLSGALPTESDISHLWKKHEDKTKRRGKKEVWQKEGLEYIRKGSRGTKEERDPKNQLSLWRFDHNF